ncbi:MAG TPA: hypothetical protein VK789_28910 [Bryobacteraceae bacterium]|nr:hypothetical protein [Bryobacteraceae bacterium]
MKLFVCACFFGALASLSQAQTHGSIPSNAKIYINATSGFDTYLDSALRKQGVPLSVTTQRDGADYELQALSGGRPIPGSDWLMLWIRGYGEASVRVVNLHTSETVFYTQLDHNSDLHNWDTAAKACASRLKAGVRRGESRIRTADPTLDF